MPAYNSGAVYSVAPGDLVTLLDGTENINGNTPYASRQVALIPVGGVSGRRLRLEGVFGGAPGAFQVAVQEAANDTPNAYTTPAAATAIAVDGNQRFSIDVLDGLVGPFVRANVASLANAVPLTLTMSVI